MSSFEHVYRERIKIYENDRLLLPQIEMQLKVVEEHIFFLGSLRSSGLVYIARYRVDALERCRLLLSDRVSRLREHWYMNQYLLRVIPYIHATTCTGDSDEMLHGGPVLLRRAETTHKIQNAASRSVDLQTSITDVVEVTVERTKGAVFAEYMADIEHDFTMLDKYREDTLDYCSHCKKSTQRVHIEREATLICVECGSVEVFQEEGAPGLTYKEELDTHVHQSAFAYKRSNHFTDWLNSVESKSNSDLPSHVFDSMRYELRKLRIESESAITPKLIRSLLKKQRLNKYYDHVNHITSVLSGRSALVLEDSLKEKLRNMFNDIQDPFNLYKPKDRKNFLSYSYVIYKSLQLLNRDDLLCHFTLLKSREKLHQQDVIWKRICHHLSWQFIKSV